MRLRAIIRTRLSNPLQQTTILNDHTYLYGLRIFNQSVQRINGNFISQCVYDLTIESIF